MSPARKIAINTRSLLVGKLDGIGWFTYQIVKRWVEENPHVEFYLLFDRPYESSFIFGPNVKPIVVSPPARHPLLWYIWYEWMIPRMLKRIDPDVFVSLDTYTSIRWPGRKITAIHDIAFALFDGQVDYLTEKYLRYYTPRYISSSEKIITVSQSTKNDLIKHYSCPASKIIVSNNAPAEVYQPMNNAEIVAFKQKNTNSDDFFVYVGSIHPRKNVLNMLKAYEDYRSKNTKSVKMVLIGRNWNYKEVKTYLHTMKYKEDIIEVPHSSPENIAQWLGSAIALLLVSHYEGFGVPIVEALACAVPVICANVSSMPEVAGGGAMLINPNNISEISAAMKSIAENEALRNTLIQNGQEHIKQYSWDNAADLIWREME